MDRSGLFHHLGRCTEVAGPHRCARKTWAYGSLRLWVLRPRLVAPAAAPGLGRDPTLAPDPLASCADPACPRTRNRPWARTRTRP